MPSVELEHGTDKRALSVCVGHSKEDFIEFVGETWKLLRSVDITNNDCEATVTVVYVQAVGLYSM